MTRFRRHVAVLLSVGAVVTEFPPVFARPQSTIDRVAWLRGFPQRVGYRKSESGLATWIEGSMRGQSRHIDFNYARLSYAAH